VKITAGIQRGGADVPAGCTSIVVPASSAKEELLGGVDLLQPAQPAERGVKTQVHILAHLF
jgi:hypothetical protein